MLIGAAIGVALAVMTATGLLGMAIWVASTEQDRYCDEHYIENVP